MVDIFSKSDGPRREDVAARRIIEENKTTIHRLADQISGGEFSRSRAAMRKAKEEPKPDGLSIHILGDGSSGPRDAAPVVRISLNDRVIVVDDSTGKQMQFLGQIREKDGQRFFALATRENGFMASVDEETENLLSDLNGVCIESENIEEKFKDVIGERLDL